MADWYVSSVAWAAIPQFAATHAYVIGNIVRPLTAPAFNAQHAFRCTTAGTSGAEPAWPAANNSTVTTGGATFTNVTSQAAYGWGAAAGSLYSINVGVAANARPASGDRVFLSSDHSESSTANTTYGMTTVAGYGVVQAISVNRAGSVPPVAADALSGASITYTDSGSNVAMQLDPVTNQYWQGVTFTYAGTGTAGIYLAYNGTKTNYFKNCAIVLSTTSPLAKILSDNPTRTILDNTTVSFNNASQGFSNGGGFAIDLIWLNTPSAIAGTAPSILFSLTESTSASSYAILRGVDLNALTGTILSSSNTVVFGKILLDSCRIASSVTRLGASTLATDSSVGEVELVNCYDGTHILSERHTPAGDLTTDISTTMTGGAQDDVGLYSHKLISSTHCDPWSMPLDSFWMDVENSYVGATRTATVEIVSSASLNNTDITLEVEYQGTSGSSLGSFAFSATPLTAVAALPTSSQTWNSPPSTPVYQHIQVTFTPQQAGRVRGKVNLGKVSTTVWINPQIIIT